MLPTLCCSLPAGVLTPTSPICFAEVVHYYLYCDQSLSNPFQQVWGSWHPTLRCLGLGVALGSSVTAPCSPLAGSHRLPALAHHHADPDPGPDTVCTASLPHGRGTGWGELGSRAHRSAPHPTQCCPDHPCPLLQKDLLGVQQLLNSSETSLHQLTAMLDCRGLHKVRGGPGKGCAAPGVAPPTPPALSHPLSCHRTTWTPLLASATMGWRVCSTWSSSPCWWPPPSPPSSAPRRAPGSTSPGGGSARTALTGGHGAACVARAGHGVGGTAFGTVGVSTGALSPQGPGLR